MKFTFIILSLVVLIVIGAALMTPWRNAIIINVLLSWGIGIGVTFVVLLIARVIAGKGLFSIITNSPSSPQESTCNKHAIIISVIAIILECLLITQIAQHIGSIIVSEVIYYSILIITGLYLAIWCKAPSYLPILVGIFVLVLISLYNYFIFVSDSGIEFRFGSERFIYACRDVALLMRSLFTDIAIILSSWLISCSIKVRMSN